MAFKKPHESDNGRKGGPEYRSNKPTGKAKQIWDSLPVWVRYFIMLVVLFGLTMALLDCFGVVAAPGSDCCLESKDCYTKLRACQELPPVETTRVIKTPCPPAPKPPPCPVHVCPEYDCPEPGCAECFCPPEPIKEPQRNAIGGGVAAFFIPDFNGHYDVELGPAVSYQRFFYPQRRWIPDELHVGASAAEVPVSETTLGYCPYYGGGGSGGWWRPCLKTATGDEWLYQATVQGKWRF